jgi:hypothetical protein
MRPLRSIPAVVVLVTLTVGSAACTATDRTTGGATSSVTAPIPSVEPTPSTPASAMPSSEGSLSPTPSPLPPAEPEFLPDPDRPIPKHASGLADDLELDTDALAASIRAWVDQGDPARSHVPLDVRLQALYQQRLYRALVGDPSLADDVIVRLPKALARTARAIVDAGASITSIVHPVASPSVIRTRRPPSAGDLLGWFREAESRFGVDWEVVAAVMFVESKFGRVRSASSAGAQGPMQFLPSTWSAYGLGGDIHDAHDAILAAANYLHASGAPTREREALHAYNHSWAYVDAIEGYAGRMRADPMAFYAFYNWQVFVLITKGAVRLTGPGL